MTNGWPDNSPDRLEDICVQFCATNIETFAAKNETSGQYDLQEGITLPKSICDKLLKALVDIKPSTVHENFTIFSDTARSQLSSICLRKSRINDKCLKLLENQPIVDLELSNCQELTRESLKTINKFQRTLKSVRIEGRSLFYNCDENTNALDESAVLECPNLRTLCIQDYDFNNPDDLVLSTFLLTLPRLTHLDLSNCGLCAEHVTSFQSLPQLRSLNLSNIMKEDGSDTENKQLLTHIGQLKSLRHLDISVADDPVKFLQPDKTLSDLVSALPQLVSLDISGTNLPGYENAEEEECCIVGLNGRQFKFLGLLDCLHDPCFRENLPAEQVTGHGTEDQVLLSVQRYQDRSVMLCSALNKLFHLFQAGVVSDQCKALECLLEGMQRHPADPHVQISGSASLFYIAKGDQKENLTQKQKRKVIDLVLDGMEAFSSEKKMMRNGCLTLCYFNVSQDVLYCYSRISRVLLDMLKVEQEDDFIHRIGIYLLNCLACQVNKQQKALVGKLGAIDTMLMIIKKKLDKEECDDMMEVAWSSMWNITDETAENCKRFINCDGMLLFLRCLKMFKDRGELLRNMMGLMGNIAEVKDLRHQLMNSSYITVFSDLLDSTSDGIEVSYNAAGVLAHLASDGPDRWCKDKPSREDVLSRLTRAIKRWDITSKRNINYRSFEPILRLLVHFDTPEVQLWAVWALCNLTKVYPEKYCELLENEGGIPRLSVVLNDPRSQQDIKELITSILQNLQAFKEKPDEEDMDNT
ncbi:hypothetical protein SNE40_000841 [Patella caerulea]|uniref:Protein zer-1 homolog n=1 Tax=Patella caerulea TaxID=87958 RepID=A0AAN8Q7I0_PATCE